jgi:hypothetical protein
VALIKIKWLDDSSILIIHAGVLYQHKSAAIAVVVLLLIARMAIMRCATLVTRGGLVGWTDDAAAVFTDAALLYLSLRQSRQFYNVQ